MYFENVVFAGGGNRCFWQAGFWQTIEPFLTQAPKRIASVSAGSAISCALFSGRFKEVYENTLQVMTDNRKNRYWKNLFSKDPIHPHNTLYRHIIETSIDASALEILRKGPENRILVAHIPPYLGPKTATLLGLTAYQLEKKLFHPVHPKFGKKIGFKPEFVPVQECQNVEQLIDLIISSSCTPPFTPIMFRKKRAVLDGGMIDNIPVEGVENESGNTLVMCSRPYLSFPEKENKVYIAPSKKVPVTSWDYTNPEAVKATYRQGQEDAKQFISQMNLS